MTEVIPPDPTLLKDFCVQAPDFVECTAIATIWKVTRKDGTKAALKIYHNGIRSEAHGIDLLKSLEGKGVAYIYKKTSTAVLLEWLEGPSLGDLARRGQDELAALELVRTANEIHAHLGTQPPNFPKLETWFNNLFELHIDPAYPTQNQKNIKRCQSIARGLLASQTDVRPLHGDLHHDNVRRTNRGFCAFDAKGLLGERTYELANAFRHPRGTNDLVCNHERIDFIATLWAAEFNVQKNRLLQWAAVKCALSIVWRSSPNLEIDPELDLLSALFNAIET